MWSVGFPGGVSGREPTCQWKRHNRFELNPGSGRSPGEGYSNPLQYSCLENSMNRRAWWATVHRVDKNQTRLKQLTMHTSVVSRTTKEVKTYYDIKNL